ncbi:uncharacterized protein LOC113793818 isoform X1 [Dermatophagoides pteronyssinus]|uniref:Uncharacterized protein n=2 Tax=Dermatophagoides pteronyssinus TaxID=6956 RepID=A0ABQ8ISN6_DERPT|nr:cold and drought-regulated protein CORA-like isoform X1 [Dermatophagoides pteronyssinus]KAH9413328.1 hypothetical protein DERP_007804 [Dermatophagoides pteronyssinus]
MKFIHSFAIVFTCLVMATMFFGPPAPVEAKKKKLLTAILLGALLGSKQKLMPLPLPLPIPLPIKHEKVIPYPEPYHYPVYSGGYEHGGGYGGGGYGGGDHYAAASGYMPQYALPPQGYRPY